MNPLEYFCEKLRLIPPLPLFGNGVKFNFEVGVFCVIIKSNFYKVLLSKPLKEELFLQVQCIFQLCFISMGDWELLLIMHQWIILAAF